MTRCQEKRQKSYRSALLVAAVSVAAVGCGPIDQLFFYQSTMVGVDVATDQQTSTVHAVFGYDRQTSAYVPRSVVRTTTCPTGQTCADEPQAMSVISKTDVEVGWFGNQVVSERFATGQAAVNIAKDESSIRKLATGSPSTTIYTSSSTTSPSTTLPH